MNSKQTEVRKIGDGRIIYDGETYVNEKSSRVIPTSEFIKQSLPSKPVGDVEEMLNKTMFMAGGNTDEQKDYYSLGFKPGYAAAPQKGMEFVEWQLCPKCNGDGNLARYNSPSIIGTDAALLCDICKGAKMIPKIELDESPSPSEAGDGWVSVEDGLPSILDGNVAGYVMSYRRTDRQWGWPTKYGFSKWDRVTRRTHTHWRPLPAPPIQKTVK